MKSKLLVLSGVALLALTGCTKELTRDEVKTHIETNFTSTAAVQMTCAVDTKVNKLEGAFESLKGSIKDGHTEQSVQSSPVTYAEINKTFASDLAKFYADGKKLTAKYDLKDKDCVTFIEQIAGSAIPSEASFTLTGTAYVCIATDDAGYITKNEMKCDLTMSYDLGALGTQSGTIAFETVATYTKA